jgi:hypothetical protein
MIIRRLAFVGTLLIAACAQSPESIAPMHVSDVPYQSYTCEQLGAEHVHVQTALTQASQQQSNARSNDIAGVLLLGLPVGSMSGQNVAPMIAQYRGQLEAIRRAGIRRNCGFDQAAVTPVAVTAPGSSQGQNLRQ